MDVEPGQHRQTTRHQRDPHKPPDHCVNRFERLVGCPVANA